MMNATNCLKLASCRRRGAGGNGLMPLQNVKVAILGACGGIGQPLSMLLKLCPLVAELRLYDVVDVGGAATDLSHIDSSPQVNAFQGPDELEAALSGVHLVLMPAGVPCKPGMTQNDLFATNAAIVRDLASACAKRCPEAFLAVIANPLNCTLPIAATIYEKEGVFDRRRMFGITTLDTIRANCLVGQFKGVDPSRINVPVIGGHCERTMVPVLSQMKPSVILEEQEFGVLVEQIRAAADLVVSAKDGIGSAALSMAHATARFTVSLLHAMSGAKDIIECAFVRSDVREVPFFASPLLLGKDGVARNLGVGPLNDLEERLLAGAIPELKRCIQKGVDFANS